MDYRTGLIWQDCQHRTLLELFAEVAGFEESEEECARAVELIGSIAEFAAGHFAIEEEYMDQYAYPGRDEHTAAHADFLLRLDGIVADAVVADAQLLRRLAAELKQWLEEHILGADRHLAAHLRRTCPD